MSFRFKDSGRGDLNRDTEEPRAMGNNSNEAGNPDHDKSRDEGNDRFSKFGGKSSDSNRGRRSVAYGRGRRQSSPPRDKPFGDRGRDFPFPRDEPVMPGRDRSPLRGGFDDRFIGDRFKKDNMPFPRRDELGRKDLPRSSYFDEPYRDKFSSMDARSRYDAPGGFNSRFDMPEDPYKTRPYNYPSSQFKDYYSKPEGYPKPNECEIIVVNKAQRPYAETVESRMKNLGIQVDILFLKDEALLVQTIDDIARRGSLYAMVISPQNEIHGSVTLNILYGTAQEHRNMPLDDALKLVARNFHDYLRNQREVMDRDKSERGPYQGTMPADKEMQFLLRVLADGRTINLSEIETVIRYLQERRDKLKSPQGDHGPPGALTDVIDPVAGKLKDDQASQKQQDLQHRIMSLINQGGPPPSSTGSVPDASGIGGMGMNPPAGGPNQPPLEPDASGLGPNSSVRNQPGMGSNPPTMGGRDPGMGSKQSPMGPNSSNMGPNQQGMRPNQPGMGYPPSSSPSTYINFDNPSVQKALDNLMQSGPNLLKNISMSGSNSGNDQNMPGSNQMKQPPMGAMNPQGGPGSMGGQHVGMGSGMGPHHNNMGPPSGPGMGPNMGPGPMSGMGSGPSPYSGQGMYGMSPNMMGSMPPRHHMMGGPGGNSGSMLGGMGGGPRRY